MLELFHCEVAQGVGLALGFRPRLHHHVELCLLGDEGEVVRARRVVRRGCVRARRVRRRGPRGRGPGSVGSARCVVPVRRRGPDREGVHR